MPVQYRPNAPIPSAVPPPPTVEQTPYGSVLPPGSDWLKWLGQLANRPELDVAPNPLGVGVGVVRGATPAAEGLANFVRRVWPKLGKAADKLHDINLAYGGPGSGDRMAWYSSAKTRPQPDWITIPREFPNEYGEMEPTNAPQAVKSYLHELLHAFYERKNLERPAYFPYKHTPKVWDRLKSELSPARQQQWKRQPEHGVIDAMAVRLWRQRLGDPSKSRLRPGTY